MRQRSKTLMIGKSYKLHRSKNKKTSGIKFVITLTDDYWRSDSYPRLHHELRRHLDPFHNRSIGSDLVWKFNTREEAEHLISLAILKGLL